MCAKTLKTKLRENVNKMCKEDSSLISGHRITVDVLTCC